MAAFLHLPSDITITSIPPTPECSCCPIALYVAAVLLLLADDVPPQLPHVVVTHCAAQPGVYVLHRHLHTLEHGHGGVLPVGQGHALDQGWLGECQDCQPLELSLRMVRMITTSLGTGVGVTHC